MSSLVQRVMAEIHQLSTQEKWQVMSQLMSELQRQSALQPLKQNTSRQHEDEVDAFIQEIEGCWGHLSREEIDAQLERQRLFDWGE